MLQHSLLPRKEPASHRSISRTIKTLGQKEKPISGGFEVCLLTDRVEDV